MINEIPASAQLTVIERHMSKRVQDMGLVIGQTRDGRYGVGTISRVAGRLTYYVTDIVGSEKEAREVANGHWLASRF